MTTKDFKLRGGMLDSFIDFAAGEPYCLDFGDGGQQGTISWQLALATITYAIPYKSIEGGFEIGYDAQEDKAIMEQIASTVQAYNTIGSAGSA